MTDMVQLLVEWGMNIKKSKVVNIPAHTFVVDVRQAIIDEFRLQNGGQVPKNLRIVNFGGWMRHDRP